MVASGLARALYASDAAAICILIDEHIAMLNDPASSKGRTTTPATTGPGQTQCRNTPTTGVLNLITLSARIG